MVCGSNTPPDEGANFLHFGVLALRQLNALWEVPNQHFQKQFVLTFEIHICWMSNVFFQSMFSFKRSLTQSPRHDATSPAAGSQHETANALGLTATSRLMTFLRRATLFFFDNFSIFSKKNVRKKISILLDFFTSFLFYFSTSLLCFFLFFFFFSKNVFSCFSNFHFFSKKNVFSTKFTI